MEERAAMSDFPEISKEAIRDLDEIWDFIAKDSVRAADRFVDQLFEKCCEIARFEGVGRRRDELIPGMESLAFKKYLIFFRRTDGRVQIIRILSGYRDIGSLFGD